MAQIIQTNWVSSPFFGYNQLAQHSSQARSAELISFLCSTAQLCCVCVINWIFTGSISPFTLFLSSYPLHNAVADVQQGFVGPLDLNVDISVLAGHSLLITERHNLQKKSGHLPLKKAASVGYRSTTTNRLFSSVSAEEESTCDTTKVATKQTKQRWTLQLFGVKVSLSSRGKRF